MCWAGLIYFALAVISGAVVGAAIGAGAGGGLGDGDRDGRGGHEHRHRKDKDWDWLKSSKKVVSFFFFSVITLFRSVGQ